MNYTLAKSIKEYFAIIAILLSIFSLVGAYWLYQNSQPTYTTLKQNRTLYAYEGKFEHWSKVTEPNLLWPVGTSLKDRNTYFLTVSPILNSKFDFRLEGKGTIEGGITSAADLTVTASKEDEVYWMEKYPLTDKSKSLEDGVLTMEMPELDLAQIKERIENIQENIKFASGITQVEISIEVLLNGTIDGEEIKKQETYKMPIKISRTSYQVEKELSKEEEVTEIVEKEFEKDSPHSAKILPLSLLIFPIGALGYITFERRRLDNDWLMELKKTSERSEFSDWISQGKLPNHEFEVEVPVDSLEDLIDAAVDMDDRIIYDNEKAIYFFIKDGMLYFAE